MERIKSLFLNLLVVMLFPFLVLLFVCGILYYRVMYYKDTN